MRRKLACLVVASALLVVGPPAFPQEASRPTLPNDARYQRNTGWIVSVNARDEPLTDVLKRVEKLTGARIALDPAAEWGGQKVNLRCADQPLMDCLRLILTAATPGLTRAVPRLVVVSSTSFRIVAQPVDASGLPDATADVEFKDARLESVLKMLLHDYAYRFTSDLGDKREVREMRVTGTFRNTPVREVFSTLLTAAREKAGTPGLDFAAVPGSLALYVSYDPADFESMPDTRVSVETYQMPARQVLELLAKSANLQYDITPDVEGAITYSCQGKKIREALLEVLALLPRGQNLRVRYTSTATSDEVRSLVIRRVAIGPDGLPRRYPMAGGNFPNGRQK